MRVLAPNVAMGFEQPRGERGSTTVVEISESAELQREEWPFRFRPPNAPNDGASRFDNRLRHEGTQPIPELHLHLHLAPVIFRISGQEKRAESLMQARQHRTDLMGRHASR